MRCEECLGVIEEYFDGETDGRTGEQLDAHLAACAECSAAFDALGREQEVYMRYERELEVTPALWQGVRAEIARTQIIEEAERPLPLITRLRERLALALGALAMRPALASSMALVVLGVTIGALWFGRTPQQPDRPQTREEVASVPGKGSEFSSTRPSPVTPTPGALNTEDDPVAPPNSSAGTHNVVAANNSRGRTPDPTAGGVDNSATTTTGDVIVSLDDHTVRQDDPLLALLPTQLTDPVEVMGAAELADPEQKEVARHVEKAQMLLRSFRNVDYSKGEAAAEDLAYEKKLSRKLLDENVSLQLEAETAGNKEAGRVLDSLEPFLLDISNLRDKPSREEVRSIKERMEKREIIAALQVY